MQGIKIIVNNPTPKKTKVDTFEDTMLLIDIYRHKMELEIFEKKVITAKNILSTYINF